MELACNLTLERLAPMNEDGTIHSGELCPYATGEEVFVYDDDQG